MAGQATLLGDRSTSWTRPERRAAARGEGEGQHPRGSRQIAGDHLNSVEGRRQLPAARGPAAEGFEVMHAMCRDHILLRSLVPSCRPRRARLRPASACRGGRHARARTRSDGPPEASQRPRRPWPRAACWAPPTVNFTISPREEASTPGGAEASPRGVVPREGCSRQYSFNAPAHVQREQRFPGPRRSSSPWPTRPVWVTAPGGGRPIPLTARACSGHLPRQVINFGRRNVGLAAGAGVDCRARGWDTQGMGPERGRRKPGRRGRCAPPRNGSSVTRRERCAVSSRPSAALAAT